MRHRKSGVKLNRTSSHRKAMFRNMLTSLFKYQRIQTTDAKAKELRGRADHLITLAKRGDLHARRQALAVIREKAVVHKLFEEAAERYGAVSGGYTRVVKLGRRPGDAAPVSIIELVSGDVQRDKPSKKKKRKAAKKATSEEDKSVLTKAETEDAQPSPTEADAGEAAASARVETADSETMPSQGEAENDQTESEGEIKTDK